MSSGLIQGKGRGRITCQVFYAETALQQLRLYLEGRYGLA